MKILFIHHSGLVGGAGVSVVNLLKETANNNEVTICLPNAPQDMLFMVNEIKHEFGINIFTYRKRIGAITWYSGGDRWYSPRLLYRLILIIYQWKYWNRFINKIDPDLVICNSKILSWMSLLSVIRKRRSLCFVRETMKQSPGHFMNRLMKSCLERFTGVVFISEYDSQKERLQKARSFVVPNYVNVSQLNNQIARESACHQLDIPSESFNVLYVGGVFPLKGFDLAVQAVLKCQANVHLIVAGMNFNDAHNMKSSLLVQYAEKWQNYINEHDTNSRIHFIGKQLDMSVCYAACNVLVFPMREPHQARPVFEAGYFSKPVIVTDFDCIHDEVKDGINGFLIPAENVNVFSEKIQYLCTHSDVIVRMGKNNYENYLLKHSCESSLKAFNNCLEEITRI